MRWCTLYIGTPFISPTDQVLMDEKFLSMGGNLQEPYAGDYISYYIVYITTIAVLFKLMQATWFQEFC